MDAAQRTEVQHLLTHSTIEPLKPEADYLTALQWATQLYLPLRQMELSNAASEQTKADMLAESFTNWLLNNYPSLTNYDTKNSPINVRTHHIVKKL